MYTANGREIKEPDEFLISFANGYAVLSRCCNRKRYDKSYPLKHTANVDFHWNSLHCSYAFILSIKRIQSQLQRNRALHFDLNSQQCYTYSELFWKCQYYKILQFWYWIESSEFTAIIQHGKSNQTTRKIRIKFLKTKDKQKKIKKNKKRIINEVSFDYLCKLILWQRGSATSSLGYFLIKKKKRRL